MRGLSTQFETERGRVHAVEDVTFALRPRRALGIVGESGSGKSVLLRSLIGLHDPALRVHQEGQVHFGGEDLLALPEPTLRRHLGTKIAMVFQDPLSSLNPAITVGRQIVEGLRTHHPIRRRAARTLGIDALRAVGLSDPERRFDQYPHELSGGMRQRATIAAAVVGNPSVLLADEPTTALDVSVQRQVLDLLHGLQTERGMAMVLVTHDLGVVRGRTDETVVLYGGQVVERAATSMLFRRPRHPYTVGLASSAPTIDKATHERLPTIPGSVPSPFGRDPGCRFAPRCARAADVCRSTSPPLVESEPGHWHRCYFPMESTDDDVG